MKNGNLNRRQFIRTTAATAAGVAAGVMTPACQTRGVAIVADPADPVASSEAARWAASELQRAVAERGLAAGVYESAAQVPGGHLRILAAGLASPGAAAVLDAAGARAEAVPEALALCPGKEGVWAFGHDARGLTYALLELADRVRHDGNPLEVLAVPDPVIERPANVVRSITRLFTSDIEDKPWYNDREMWPAYLSMLAAQRFNRFSLAFGIGYDFLRNVTDGYFLFAYPFLLSVPGYDVHVPELPDAERDSNLEMLRFISEQTVARGMEFQLGIWMHGYRWIDSPNPNYTIEGLTPETHGAYCRDALRALLQAVPKISGITFRVHGESGVPEGSYQFWKTVFDGVATCGRRVEIDMHAKGMTQGMIDTALGTGQPVKVSPKYWAEHLGLPYQQADIREQERPHPRHEASGLMKFSAGSRSFLRYGYGDLLPEDRKWNVLYRIWPGTQRLLIWGDPVTAASYSRAFSFCDSAGVEIMEPLSFKGRRGTGIAGGRCAYADQSLNPRWDWQKYAYSYRVWGRLLYDPETDPDVWQRAMRHQFGPAGADLEMALANSSRILPTVTTAHEPSAGNNTYWPEVYLNHSLVDAEHPGPYTDSPVPHVFGTVSPLDPQLFYRINDFADDLLKGECSGKYTPIEAAQWIEDYAAAATASLKHADDRASGKDRPEYRRLTIDTAAAADLGRFFGAKFRAGVLYRLFDQPGDRAALEEALQGYRSSHAAWAAFVDRTRDVYMAV
ncbi:MAG: twin-arginine translocation signal domain-containing protein, partial [Acidobacteriota bacterium]